LKKVLVTGASGFVGRHLLEALSISGVSTEAVYFSHPPQSDSAADVHVRWTKADLTSDSVDHLLHGVDTIFHLAGYAGQGADPQTIADLETINVGMTRRVARMAASAGGRLVYVSSVHAGDGDAQTPLVDEENGKVLTPYGRSKRRAEDVLHSHASEGLDYVILRPTQLFGEYHEGSLYELARAIQRRRFFLIGDGQNPTNFFYVKDFINSLMLVASSDRARQQTYVAANEAVPLRSLVRHIAEQLGVSPPELKVPLDLGLFLGGCCDLLSGILKVKVPLSRQRVLAMTRDVHYSTRKLERDIGVSTIYGPVKGLTRTIDWYRYSGLLN
jgi:nucleoside-diphosphate-sugar epimerase